MGGDPEADGDPNLPAQSPIARRSDGWCLADQILTTALLIPRQNECLSRLRFLQTHIIGFKLNVETIAAIVVNTLKCFCTDDQLINCRSRLLLLCLYIC